MECNRFLDCKQCIKVMVIDHRVSEYKPLKRLKELF